MTDLHPHSEINPRLQKIDKVVLLAHCPLFSGLSQWELKSISQLMRLVEYKKDEIVYPEGIEPEAFYVVVSGRFEAYVATSTEKKKTLAYLRRGDHFGEMSLLTGQPHSATIRALSDCLTLELKKDDFKKTIEHNAVISLELSRRLSSRLKGGDGRTRSLLRSDIISIYTNQQKTGRAVFSINLAASLYQETHQKTILLDMSATGSEVASKLHLAKKILINEFQNIENETPAILAESIQRHPAGFDVLSVAPVEKADNLIVPLLNHLAIDYRFILIDLPDTIDESSFKAMTQSDFIFFSTDSNMASISETKSTIADIEKNLAFPEEKISVIISEVFFGMRTTAAAKKELFGKKFCYSLPAVPALKTESAVVTPLVVDEPDAEYSRVVRHIARRVSNNLVGLALGSGAALGLAHIGVLKVLERERIPVDIISGSSIGALIAALYATGKSATEIEEIFLAINSRKKLLGFLDIALVPLRGFLYGRRVMKHFKGQLGNKVFEDCRIPLKIVGANLSSREMIIFESGFISDAVRSSIAIPAIFWPTFVKGDLVVDGGIMSPLPIRALHHTGANKVIAVNVFPTAKDTLERRIIFDEMAEKEERLMRGKNRVQRAFYRLKRHILRRFFPSIFDILMNTIQTMESEIAEMEGEAADVLLRPVLATASWVEFYKPRHFIKRGEEETEKMLPKIKSLVSHQNV